MRVYGWNEEGLLIDVNGRELREDPLNGGYLPMRDNESGDPLPTLKKNQTLKREGGPSGRWVVVDDYRGQTYYDKTTGEIQLINETGKKPSTGWTDKPRPDQFHIFDANTKDWKFDLALYKQLMIERVSQMSFYKRALIFPDYKFNNLLAGLAYPGTSFTLGNYKATVQAFRDVFYITKSQIEGCEAKEDVDAIMTSIEGSWPGEIVSE